MQDPRGVSTSVIKRMPINQLLIVSFDLLPSDIQSISPSSGSLLGGTVITIGGVGFSDIAKNVKVFVAGILSL